MIRGAIVLECSGFSAEGQPSSFGAIRLAAPASSGAVVDLYFLDANGTIVRTQHAELMSGAQMSFGIPTREMGSTLWVVGSETVDVQVALVSPGTLAGLGLAAGGRVTLAGDRGSVALPVGTADLPDDVVWLPGNTGGVNVNRDLASPGSPVRVTGGAA